MPRSTNKLTARQVATVSVPGYYDDGDGLYLIIASEGSRSWCLIYPDAGHQAEMELGDAAILSLTMARRLAVDMRYSIAAGHDPRSVSSPTMLEVSGSIPTFGAFAESYVSSIEKGFKNPRYHQDWRNALYTYARPLLSKPINKIATDDVVAVVKPIWPRPTARRLRGRIEKIFEAATALGFLPEDAINPAAWRGHLIHLLPPPSSLVKGHHAALSWKDAPTFIAELRSRQALAARCLEFVILTAARSGECLGSTWGEIDLEFSLWSIPATRMGSGVKHVIPLSSAVVALLIAVRPKVWEADMLVFGVNDAPLSSKAISMLLRLMKRDSVTTLGFAPHSETGLELPPATRANWRSKPLRTPSQAKQNDVSPL